MDWQPIETAPPMIALLLHHEYYSHGQVRHGYMDRKGLWRGIDSNGRDEAALSFDPTHWMHLPERP